MKKESRFAHESLQEGEESAAIIVEYISGLTLDEILLQGEETILFNVNNVFYDSREGRREKRTP